MALNTFLPLGIKLPISLHSDFFSSEEFLRTYNGPLRAIHLRKRTTLFPEKKAFILTVTQSNDNIPCCLHLFWSQHQTSWLEKNAIRSLKRDFQMDRKLNGCLEFFFFFAKKNKTRITFTGSFLPILSYQSQVTVRGRVSTMKLTSWFR